MTTIINSNIYISLAAVFMTLETQIQLGMNPQFHPYHFLIFFATLFEYNLHRLVTMLTNKEALRAEKHRWVSRNIYSFYGLVLASLIGFIVAVIQAKIEVILTLTPIALLTLFYSTPLTKANKGLFRLRQLPFIKIFLISFVWSTVTILLPIVQSKYDVSIINILLLILERFLFVFAITIPFDIRDMKADSSEKLKTIPLLIGENNSIRLSVILLLSFLLISIFHYTATNQNFMIWAFSISVISTIFFIKSEKIRNLPFYHYGILDGTMLLQSFLVLGFHQLFK